MTRAVTFAHSVFLEQMVFELAGLFWLLAELVILFAVLAARDHLKHNPTSPRLTLNRGLRKRAVLWGVCFALLVLLTQCRHLCWPPVYRVLLDHAPIIVPNIGEMQAMFVARNHAHWGIWAGFIAGWVLLEILIVYHGYRGYRTLKTLLGNEDE